MFDVVTFGSAVVDVFVDTDISEKGKFMCYPVGAKILLKNLKFDIGGGGTNTAVAFSRMKLKTGYIGKIGDDNNGENILETLKKEKIKFLGRIEKGAISGYSIILDSKNHNRTILTYKGVNNNLKEIKTPRTRWLYYSSLLGQSYKTQLKLAKASKAKLAFNPSEYLIKAYNIKPMLKLTDVLILNKEEANLLAKTMKELHKLGPEIICITNKNKDIVCSDKTKTYRLKPNNIKVIERTGAGDAFASTFVAGLIKNLNIQQSLKLALKNSESVIKHFGAKNNLLRMKLK